MGAGDVVAYDKTLIDEYYFQKFTAPTIAKIPKELNTSLDDMMLDKISTIILDIWEDGIEGSNAHCSLGHKMTIYHQLSSPW